MALLAPCARLSLAIVQSTNSHRLPETAAHGLSKTVLERSAAHRLPDERISVVRVGLGASPTVRTIATVGTCAVRLRVRIAVSLSGLSRLGDLLRCPALGIRCLLMDGHDYSSILQGRPFSNVSEKVVKAEITDQLGDFFGFNIM